MRVAPPQAIRAGVTRCNAISHGVSVGDDSA